MKLSVYYVDAFTDKLFSGNPAAVIFSDLTDTLTMQNIAAENNLSETAFIREEGGIYYIRWFAPSCEIDLCGHATLASAYTYFNFINPGISKPYFKRRFYMVVDWTLLFKVNNNDVLLF